MGIPAYFSYIVRKYPNIIELLDNIKIDNLFLDCNSLIYDTYNVLQTNNQTLIINGVIERINNIANAIKPQKILFIAFDGVAPMAKLNQQRERRYKIEHEIRETPSVWNTLSITPGTKFMNMLNLRIYEYYASVKVQYKIIVSGSNQIGEGEHKIYEYIRKNPATDEITIIYGNDSDLFMLSINHLPFYKKIYIMKDTQELSKFKTNINLSANYIIDVANLMNKLIVFWKEDINLENSFKQINITDNGENDNEENDNEKLINCINDYIFICFFLGNDFLPKFPALNIRTGGIDKLMNVYKINFGILGKNIINKQEICWKNVKVFVEYLADHEEEYFIKEHKYRDHNPYINSPDPLYLPMTTRIDEKYINPFQPNWQKRYYERLCNSSSPERMSKKYLQGLEWNFKYYTIGCVDYRWMYQ